MGVVARAMSSFPLSLPSPKRASVAPAPVVGHGGEDPLGGAVGRRVQLSLEEPHPEREVDEVRIVEVRRERTLQALARRSEIPTNEGAAHHELHRLGHLALVARRRGVGTLERTLRRLRRAEAIEHAREHALHAGARVGILHVARLHELLERVCERRARGGHVALVARHVADGQ